MGETGNRGGVSGCKQLVKKQFVHLGLKKLRSIGVEFDRRRSMGGAAGILCEFSCFFAVNRIFDESFAGARSSSIGDSFDYAHLSIFSYLPVCLFIDSCALPADFGP